MKHLLSLVSLAIFLIGGNLFAQDSSVVQKKNQFKHQYKHQTKTATMEKGQHGVGFVDENGDGYNDNAPDDDGDGIPNGLDEDYEGSMSRAGNGRGGFIDLDGDGINDNAMDSDGDGIPNGQDEDFVRPEDGSGQMNRFGGNQAKGMNGNSGDGTAKGSGIGTGDGNSNEDKGSKKRGSRD